MAHMAHMARGHPPVVAAENQVVKRGGHLVPVLLHELGGVVDHLAGEVHHPERRLRARAAAAPRPDRIERKQESVKRYALQEDGAMDTWKYKNINTQVGTWKQSPGAPQLKTPSTVQSRS